MLVYYPQNQYLEDSRFTLKCVMFCFGCVFQGSLKWLSTNLNFFFPVKYSSFIMVELLLLWLYLLGFSASYKSLVMFDTLFLSRTFSQGKQ